MTARRPSPVKADLLEEGQRLLALQQLRHAERRYPTERDPLDWRTLPPESLARQVQLAEEIIAEVVAEASDGASSQDPS